MRAAGAAVEPQFMHAARDTPAFHCSEAVESGNEGPSLKKGHDVESKNMMN